jgi:AcrR family transcriptional regulator
MWWVGRQGDGGPRPGRAGGLDLDRVLAVALAIVDRDGLDALTMRRLADELATRHTSLYRRVASRDELIVLLVDRVVGELDLPDPRLPWRRHAEQLARDYRRLLLRHRPLLPAFSAAMMGPNVMGMREAALGVLLGAGLDPGLAARAYLTIIHFVVGSVYFGADGVPEGRAESMVAATRRLADLYPTVSTVAVELAGFGGEEEFEFGLAALLDGVEAQHAPRRN